MIVGRYSLDREIGRGGMGAVWLGRDEVLGRQVALKRIGMLPGAVSTDLARAEREARLTARLNHPHVVAVYNLVIDEESDARWLVMEYVDGPTLAQLVRDEGRLTPDAAAPLMWQTADALAAAHAAGIVHRDVKPSNILLDRLRRVKLTDFGIARITSDPSLTQTGMVTGSPAYLAPEIAAGHRGDEAADVWSLGATLFHALSGRPPYEIGEHVIGGLYRIVHEEPPRLSDAGWLTPLLEATMVREPSQRWSMAQVRDFLAGPGRGASPDRPAEPDETSTRLVAAVATPPPPVVPVETPRRPVDSSHRPLEPSRRSVGPVETPPAETRRRPLRALAILLSIGLVITAAFFGGMRGGEQDTPTATPSTASSSPSPSRSPSPSATPAQPTRAGMTSFIRRYLTTVSSDPDATFEMLTPRFQRESGGRATYRDFWTGKGRGRILELSADPETLTVSYRVRFANFGTGARTTVLDLAFEDGRYLIDGERT